MIEPARVRTRRSLTGHLPSFTAGRLPAGQ